jgi:carboxypeptidase C (cathepsin A)
MRINEIDDAIKICDSHLSSTNTVGTKIETYLVSYLLVLAVNCFERELLILIKKSISCRNCEDISNYYLKSTLEKILKKFKSSDLADFIKLLSEDHYKKYKKMRNNRKIAKVFTFYDNIQINRQSVAHKEGVNMTFIEFKKFYNEGHYIIEIMQYLLNFNPNSIRELRKKEKEETSDVKDKEMEVLCQFHFR